jgi:hypothetical protein
MPIETTRSKRKRYRTALRTAELAVTSLVLVWIYVAWHVDLRNHHPTPLLLTHNITSQQRIFDFKNKQDPTGGAFVHIGKTGGSTLSKRLRNGCASMRAHPCYTVADETMASQLIHSYYHVMDFGLLPTSHHDFYLLSLRDPFDRFVSAFTYEHILNRRATNDTHSLNRFQLNVLDNAYLCFPTLEAFSAYFTQGDPYDFHYPYKYNIVEPRSCRDFALAVFHGRVRLFHHLYFNYQRIQELLPTAAGGGEGPILLATRLESLWEDWTAANRYLGQTTDVVIPHDASAHERDMMGYVDLPVTKDLSETGRQAICYALQLEYNAYFWLVSRAKNLGKKDLAETLMRARQRCPSVQLDFKALK